MNPRCSKQVGRHPRHPVGRGAIPVLGPDHVPPVPAAGGIARAPRPTRSSALPETRSTLSRPANSHCTPTAPASCAPNRSPSCWPTSSSSPGTTTNTATPASACSPRRWRTSAKPFRPGQPPSGARCRLPGPPRTIRPAATQTAATAVRGLDQQARSTRPKNKGGKSVNFRAGCLKVLDSGL